MDNFKSKNMYIFGDLNSRTGNNYPNNGFIYKNNPDVNTNLNGKRLIDILHQNKNFNIVNGIKFKNHSFDSNFTCIRKNGVSQVDIFITNRIEKVKSFTIKDKLIYSDHCPLYIELKVDLIPNLELIDECSRGFHDYSHYDVNRKILKGINAKSLNLNSLMVDLQSLGDNLFRKYTNISGCQDIVKNRMNVIPNNIVVSRYEI